MDSSVAGTRGEFQPVSRLDTLKLLGGGVVLHCLASLIHCLVIVLLHYLSAQLTNAVSRCSLLHLTLHLRGSGPNARQRSAVGKGEIVVMPHAISSDLCDDLLNKLDSLKPQQFESLATQPERLRLRRLFQLGATGKLYHRCKHEGPSIIFVKKSFCWKSSKLTISLQHQILV